MSFSFLTFLFCFFCFFCRRDACAQRECVCDDGETTQTCTTETVSCDNPHTRLDQHESKRSVDKTTN